MTPHQAARKKKISDQEFLKRRRRTLVLNADGRPISTWPLYWPKWPTLLPLIRRSTEGDENEQCGFLFNYSREAEPTVYFGNFFRIPEIADKIKASTGAEHVTWQQILATMKSRQFSSLDEVLVHYRIN